MMIPQNPMVKAPWLDNYGDVPAHLDYYTGTLSGAVEETAKLYPDVIAYDFMGSNTTYKQAVEEIHCYAKCLAALDLKPGDRGTI